MHHDYLVQPGMQQQIAVQRETEITCLSGKLHINIMPHLLGDTLVTGQRTLMAGQGFRAIAAGYVTLYTDRATRYTVKMLASLTHAT